MLGVPDQREVSHLSLREADLKKFRSPALLVLLFENLQLLFVLSLGTSDVLL